MRTWLILLLVVMSGSSLMADTATSDFEVLSCELSLSNESLIALIQHLESQGNPLPERALQQLVRALSNEPVHDQNEQSALDELHPLLRRVLADQLQRVIDREKVAQWIRAKIQNLKVDQGVREETVVETTAAYRPARFVRVKGGTFRIPGGMLKAKPEAFDLHLPYDFEVMETPVTEAMWSLVMGKAPLIDRKYIDRSELIQTSIHGISELIAPNHPVHGLTAMSAMEYANRVSIAQGLGPAYGLSSGDRNLFAQGTAMGSAVFSHMNLSLVEGYRLPSEVEWIILALAAHQELHGADDAEEVRRSLRWGWFVENSGGFTKEVGLLEPLRVGNGKIFDLLGLVREFSHQINHHRLEAPDEAIWPSDYGNGVFGFLELRSMSFFHQAAGSPRVRADFNREEIVLNSDWLVGVGFRLVRTLHPGQE